MKGYLLSLVLILVCFRSLKAESTEDLERMMTEVKTVLRREMAEEKRSTDAVLREKLAQDIANATKDLEEKLAIVENELELEKTVTKSLQRHIEEALPRHSQEEDQIAFSVVSYQDFGPVTVDTNIPFEVVHINIGGAWQAPINAFMAMRAGVYLFTTSSVGYGGNHVDTAIVRTTSAGSQKMAMTYSTSQATAGDANTVIFAVEAGDFVSVQLLSDNSGRLYSTPTRVYSTFSGYFLFP